MRIGELRHKATLQRYTQGQDEIGQPIYTWTDLATLGAKIEGINGREFLAAQIESQATTWRITTRYRADTRQSDRLVADGVAFNIKAVLPDNKRRQMTLMCESGLLEV